MKTLQAFAQIAAQAGQGQLRFPASVNAALELQRALADPDCHITQAIQLVQAEPLLAARTVALANSSMFTRTVQGQLTSVRGAVQRIGFANLHTLATALVVRQFGNRIGDPVLRAKAAQLWVHTAYVAALAQVLARTVTDVNPDTALFAGVVHEVGGFYLLGRAEEFPGLLDGGSSHWTATGLGLITHAVLAQLHIPPVVAEAVEALPGGLLGIPPDGLLDTLLLAKQLAPVPSPLQSRPGQDLAQSESVLDFIIDNDTLTDMLARCADEVASISAALLH